MLLRPLLLVSIVLAAVTASAQYGSLAENVGPVDSHYAVSGVVRDSHNNALSGVRVELQSTETGRTVASTFTYGNGTFEMTDVPRGHYEVVATSGLQEVRSRIDYPGSGDITLRLAVDSAADKSAGDANAVSLAQMKVPGKARKLFQKAISAFRMAKLDDAFTFVQQALGMYPDYAQALALRGVMNMQRGETQKAEPDLQKAVELDYSDDTTYVALASLYNTEGKFDNALQILDRGMSVHPNSWQALSEKARAEIGKQQYDAALKTLAKTDHYAPPTVAYLHLFRAKALSGINNKAGAMAEVEKYLEMEPNGSNAPVARKMLAELKGTAEEARK